MEDESMVYQARILLEAIQLLDKRVSVIEEAMKERVAPEMPEKRRERIRKALRLIRISFPRSSDLIEAALEAAYGSF